MITLRISEAFPHVGVSAPVSIVLRDKGAGEHQRYVVHTRNDQDGGHFQGYYSTSLWDANEEFNRRVCSQMRMMLARSES